MLLLQTLLFFLYIGPDAKYVYRESKEKRRRRIIKKREKITSQFIASLHREKNPLSLFIRVYNDTHRECWPRFIFYFFSRKHYYTHGSEFIKKKECKKCARGGVGAFWSRFYFGLSRMRSVKNQAFAQSVFFKNNDDDTLFNRRSEINFMHASWVL